MPHVAGSVKYRHDAWGGATKVRGTWVSLTVVEYSNAPREEQLSWRGATKVRGTGAFLTGAVLSEGTSHAFVGGFAQTRDLHDRLSGASCFAGTKVLTLLVQNYK